MNFKTVKSVKTLGIVVIALIVIIGALLVVRPFFEQNSKYSGDISEANSQKSIAESKLNTLKSQKAQLPAYEKVDDNLSTEFPANANMPDIDDSINSAADKNKVNIDSIEVTVPTSITTTGDSGTSSTGDSSSAAATASPSGDTPAAAAPDEASSSNMFASQVTLSVTGKSLSDVNNFIADLQNSKRNFTINKLDLGDSNESGTEAKASIVASTFIYKSIPKVGEKVTKDDSASATPTDAPAAPAN